MPISTYRGTRPFNTATINRRRSGQVTPDQVFAPRTKNIPAGRASLLFPSRHERKTAAPPAIVSRLLDDAVQREPTRQDDPRSHLQPRHELVTSVDQQCRREMREVPHTHTHSSRSDVIVFPACRRQFVRVCTSSDKVLGARLWFRKIRPHMFCLHRAACGRRAC